MQARHWVGALAAFLAVTATAAADDSLPLGDGKLSKTPKVGYLYSCETEFAGHGAAHSGPWIQGDNWFPSQKLAVQGSVPWPNSQISVGLEGSRRVIRANGLPQHTTGIFPIRPADPAYRYDRNPNSIQAQQILLTLPANPSVAAMPACLPMGVIGIALDGVAIFDAADAAGRDAAAHEVQDRCNGHPQGQGQYHYHGPSPCMQDAAGAAGRHSDLIGYAWDGYGIYGEHGEGGKLLHDTDLDACHGHTHAVMWNGRMQVIYHYHLTPEYPYTLGCFHGNVDAMTLDQTHPAMHGNPQEPGIPGGPQAGGSSSSMGGPPGMGPPPGERAAMQRAAASLGISADRLREALGPPPPNFALAAQKLGISEQALRDALRAAHQRNQNPGSAPPPPP